MRVCHTHMTQCFWISIGREMTEEERKKLSDSLPF